MKFRGWLVLFSLTLASSPVVFAETAGPSVFSGFENDPAWYAFMSGDGRTLVGWESGATRGVVRVWDGQNWERSYLEGAVDIDSNPAASSVDGRVIVGRVQKKVFPYGTGAVAWERGEAGWIRTELSAGMSHGSATGVSADGRVVVGAASGSYSWGEPSVWERSEGGWTHTFLPKPDASELVAVVGISADGNVITGNSYRNMIPYRTRGMVWRRVESGWTVAALPVDKAIAGGSRVHACARDGRSIVGHMLQKSPEYSVGAYVWTLDGETWTWTRLPELAQNQQADPWEISDDGGVIIGTADRSPETTSMRAAWKKSETGAWLLQFAGSPRETDDFPGQLTGDGRLASAQPRSGGLRMWNLMNGKLLTLQSLVANLDLGAEPGWNFSQGELQWQTYSAENNTYTIVGWGHKTGVATTFAISLYAPFLTGENPTVGGWVDVDLPDMGEEGYRMNVLPPGLRYDAATKRIYGQVTQTGTFTVKYRNLTTGRAKESLLRVVAFSPKQQGIKTVALTPTDSEGPGTGRLRVKVGKAGGVVAHLTLPAGGKPFTFSGVLVPDAESGLSVLRVKRASAEEGCTVRRGKGAAAVQYRVEMEMTETGAVTARLLGGDGAVIAEGEVAAP